MKNLQDAIEKICELKGENMALHTVTSALLQSMHKEQLDRFIAVHAQIAELARVTLINSDLAGESVISSFDLHTQNLSNLARSLR
ncbi:hypothetical protein WJ32_23170 [Burkholderia ubonensis]|uniref:Uncharacterized protein n=1 Tax=Burkholderia ubonensis TaxID=101571 RepID=A0A103QU58_9BURK|nr:hypothetical protein [Burkholderia ubonensis]AOJ65391.1 hypothetical protein WJ32_23170 [Burkholderia ubonensis]KVD57303.1 hypothetical protein WI87_18870 [Burkholderia ubonensis]KVG55627.1 hypothetical protein WJ33_06110 [Burkholderia ubonensis]